VRSTPAVPGARSARSGRSPESSDPRLPRRSSARGALVCRVLFGDACPLWWLPADTAGDLGRQPGGRQAEQGHAAARAGAGSVACENPTNWCWWGVRSGGRSPAGSGRMRWWGRILENGPENRNEAGRNRPFAQSPVVAPRRLRREPGSGDGRRLPGAAGPASIEHPPSDKTPWKPAKSS